MTNAKLIHQGYWIVYHDGVPVGFVKQHDGKLAITASTAYNLGLPGPVTVDSIEDAVAMIEGVIHGCK